MASEWTNAILDAQVANITGVDQWVSLHTADPGLTGANECTVVSRVALATAGGWSAAAADATSGGRAQSNANQLNFGNASGSQTLLYAGFWSASSGGTFRGAAPLAASQTTTTGNPVSIPVGDLVVFAAGA